LEGVDFPRLVDFKTKLDGVAHGKLRGCSLRRRCFKREARIMGPSWFSLRRIALARCSPYQRPARNRLCGWPLHAHDSELLEEPASPESGWHWPAVAQTCPPNLPMDRIRNSFMISESCGIVGRSRCYSPRLPKILALRIPTNQTRPSDFEVAAAFQLSMSKNILHGKWHSISALPPPEKDNLTAATWRIVESRLADPPTSGRRKSPPSLPPISSDFFRK